MSYNEYASPYLLLRDKFRDNTLAYILTMSNRHDRHNFIKESLTKIGWCPDGWINFYYATPFPFNDIISYALTISGKGKFTKPNEYDCSRNHYAMIKIAYDLGYEHILILEDDIMFYNNRQILKEYIKNIPDDFDVIQFGGFSADPVVYDTLDQLRKKGQLWYHNTDLKLWNCSMYMLSRKGMEYYIKFMDELFWVADGPLYMSPKNNKILKTYIPTIPIVIQEDKNILTSDIRNNENDTIDYNNQNMYERGINKEDYK